MINWFIVLYRAAVKERYFSKEGSDYINNFVSLPSFRAGTDTAVIFTLHQSIWLAAIPETVQLKPGTQESNAQKIIYDFNPKSG
jgi:hypothetical protein